MRETNGRANDAPTQPSDAVAMPARGSDKPRKFRVGMSWSAMTNRTPARDRPGDVDIEPLCLVAREGW